jgi:NAD-dependent deacetylase
MTMPISKLPKIVVLTGAGISAESGLPTFRGAGGLWKGYRVEEVASPHAFRKNPELVHAFYNHRRKALQDPAILPNPAHVALAGLEQAWGSANFFLVTQNVDNLHQRAGARHVHHLHGELLKVRCTQTGEVWPWRDDLQIDTPHPTRPGMTGTLRPHIVWFGEEPLGLPEVYGRLRTCDLFIAIGTSGQVYPAAGFVQATPAGCQRFEINLDDTPVSPDFHRQLRGLASELVPTLVAELKQLWGTQTRSDD